jgi:uncharacterized protein
MTTEPAFVPVMRQGWRHLLFLHWEVDAAELAARLPPGLELDTHHGKAYVGLIPFRVEGSRPPLLPPLPGVSTFAEVNVRTYVRWRGTERGVWFFSLDAASRVASEAARLTYRLPYHAAEGSLEEADGTFAFASRRRDGPGECRVAWRATGGASGPAPAGSLTEFLVERYALYTTGGSRLIRALVAHPPYELAPVELLSLEEDLLAVNGLGSHGRPPFVHYSPGVTPSISRPKGIG